MNNKKECKIIGFGKYVSKETNENMFRIVLGIESNRENYSGTMVAPAHLNYSLELEEILNKAIKNPNTKCYYETTDDIVSGKTKVSNITILDQ